MKQSKAEKMKLVATLLIRDEDGTLADQDFYMSKEEGVTVITNLHLGGKPLALAGLMLTGAHAMLEAANAPHDLVEAVLVHVMEVQSIIEVREMAEKQKNQDRKDHGSLDDWPASDDSDFPF